jgi:hypothetical protein
MFLHPHLLTRIATDRIAAMQRTAATATLVKKARP